jgi:isoleucyl-tRNA synthetase
VKTRQPLSRALVGAPGWSALPEELRAQLAEELNVVATSPLAEAGGDLIDYAAKGNFRALGARFAKRTPLVANAIAAADAAVLAASLRESGAATVVVEGEEVSVTADEVIVTETPREGWAVATAGGETVALDLHVTPELRLAGLARDVVRLLQETRKASGLDVADRITLTWAALDTEPGAETAGAVRAHSALIADEVLAVAFEEGVLAAGSDGAVEDADLGVVFRIAKA